MVNKNYASFYEKAQKKYTTVPDVLGMSGMDALTLLENAGIEVKIEGNGKVVEQSVKSGTKIEKNQKIVLKLL